MTSASPARPIPIRKNKLAETIMRWKPSRAWLFACCAVPASGGQLRGRVHKSGQHLDGNRQGYSAQLRIDYPHHPKQADRHPLTLAPPVHNTAINRLAMHKSNRSQAFLKAVLESPAFKARVANGSSSALASPSSPDGDGQHEDRRSTRLLNRYYAGF